MPKIFSDLTSNELLALPRNQTVFFFSVGPVEDHGPHLPLGMDLFESQAVSNQLAEKIEHEYPGWVTVFMPAVPLGIDSNTTKVSLKVRPYILRDWLIDSCLMLWRLGFRYFAVVSGHLGPRQLTAIEEAGKMLKSKAFFSKNPPLLLSLSSALAPKNIFKSPFQLKTKEHGGERDTSVALIVCPEKIAEIGQGLPKMERPERGWFGGSVFGYWGSPSEASQMLGEKVLKDQVDEIFPKLKIVLEGSPPRSLFRSWYSVLPMNKSVFKAWLLFFWILFFSAVWIWMMMNQLGL